MFIEPNTSQTNPRDFWPADYKHPTPTGVKSLLSFVAGARQRTVNTSISRAQIIDAKQLVAITVSTKPTVIQAFLAEETAL